MMFQIATGETWRRGGYDVVYTRMDENLLFNSQHYKFKRHTDVYKSLFKNFNWDRHKAPDGESFMRANVPFTYVDFIPQHGREYVGYFQSAKNFPDRDFIKWLFEPSDMVRGMDKIPICEYSCSVHVRRQDYVELQDYHRLLGMDYYRLAMDALSQHRVDKYYIFSDDLDWCRDNFIGDKFQFVSNVEYIVLYLMGMCKYNILANSSLSFWGAYLGEGIVTISPKDWFGPRGEDARDIYCDTWIRL